MRLLVPLLIATALGAVLSSCKASDSDASTSADLVLLSTHLRETASSTGLTISRVVDERVGPCDLGLGRPGTQAKVMYEVDLKGRKPFDVSVEVARRWQADGKAWFGESVQLDSETPKTNVARVNLVGGGWGLGAEVLPSGGLYALSGSGPCRS